jgi:hypothetical protein
MFFVVFSILSIDKDVIEIVNHENIKVFSEDIVDETLSWGWCIGETEGHNKVFE